MRRLLSILVWIVLGLTVASAAAQEPGRVYKIGWLWVGEPNQAPVPFEKWAGSWTPIREVLHENGFVLGKNLSVDVRSARGDIGQLPSLASALVASNIDVLVSPGTPATLAAMQVTKSVPIVVPGVGKPIEKGIVTSFSKPGGNVTGMAVNIESDKMWHLLKEIAPATRLVVTLGNARNQEGLAPDRLEALHAKSDTQNRALAASLGFDYVALRVRDVGEVDSVLDRLAGSAGTALIVLTDGTLWSWRSAIMEAARRNRMVTACAQVFEWAQEGCVLVYGEDARDMRRGAALQIVKVLRGAKPADIPVELPTKFRLIVNTTSAKALGLTVPPSLLALADEVVE